MEKWIIQEDFVIVLEISNEKLEEFIFKERKKIRDRSEI